jgi:general secretion pathway protein G
MGFTLVELMVSLTLLATLAAAVLPLSETLARREREAELRQALREIRSALDTYRRDALAGRIKHNPDDSGYPPTLAALVEGVQALNPAAEEGSHGISGVHPGQGEDARRLQGQQGTRRAPATQGAGSMGDAQVPQDGRKLYYLRRIPRDPMCDCPDTDAAETWRLRASDNGPDGWQGGRDVFDVSSGSEETGLNGIGYGQW